MIYRDDSAHLSLLAVRPNARRRGVGTAVLAWLEKVGSVAGVSRIRLEARRDNVPALTFYREHGYYERATVVGMYLGMEDGVRLEKVISRQSTGQTR
jgi:ribosomal protein S18 acetylase RimI-like enzyme